MKRTEAKKSRATVSLSSICKGFEVFFVEEEKRQAYKLLKQFKKGRGPYEILFKKSRVSTLMHGTMTAWYFHSTLAQRYMYVYEVYCYTTKKITSIDCSDTGTKKELKVCTRENLEGNLFYLNHTTHMIFRFCENETFYGLNVELWK
jgi:hypothetical protein